MPWVDAKDSECSSLLGVLECPVCEFFTILDTDIPGGRLSKSCFALSRGSLVVGMNGVVEELLLELAFTLWRTLLGVPPFSEFLIPPGVGDGVDRFLLCHVPGCDFFFFDLYLHRA